jgi:hypothetical protein
LYQCSYSLSIRISRLLSEFREQDSYINSDYDSDTSSDPECSSAPSRRAAATQLTNSIIKQADTLLRAAKCYPRAPGLPIPRIRLVLNRLEGLPQSEYRDPRIPATFAKLREMGVELVLGTRPMQLLRDIQLQGPNQLQPHRDILLDLSIIVALCCDTTHYTLPTTPELLEARFRPLTRLSSGEQVLVEHTSLTKDLRDQLYWEDQHPLIEELRDLLTVYEEGGVRLWVTKEVRDRVPGILNVIGGPGERRRAEALFSETSGEGEFWKGSRYEGTAGVLKNIHARVLEDEEEIPLERLSLNGETQAPKSGYTFEKGLVATCNLMLRHTESPTSSTASRSNSPSPSPAQSLPKRNGRKSRNPHRPTLVFPANSNLPSPHTLRSLMAGVKRGMTVLTNNRGAVGKVIREMGVREGIPCSGDGETAVIWVVNPSSLAEWRRIEVEESNLASARSDNPMK